MEIMHWYDPVDRNARHHHVRNAFADAELGAGLHPEEERMGLLPDHTGVSGAVAQLHRPADVYLPRVHAQGLTAYVIAVTPALNQRSVQHVSQQP
eukprot:3944472-Amphidinium_carterae.1